MPIVVIVSDRENTHKLTLNESEFTLGRSSSCHISIKDPMVSGKHCTVGLNENNRVIVKDLDSSNGTYLNGSKIMETSISIDDEVTIGEVRIWIDPNSLTPQERTSFNERVTQKTKLKFVDMREATNSSVGIKLPDEDEEDEESSSGVPEVTDDDIDTSGLHKRESDDSDGPRFKSDMDINIESLGGENSKRMRAEAARLSRTSREGKGPGKADRLITKNDKKEKSTIGGKLKGLFKK